jgi:general secretion pathway protein K
MRICRHNSRSGIALIVVMIAITVLSILAAGFAYSMKVETKLAQNSNSETELIWLGRSGVDAARWVLAAGQGCPFDCLNQKWVGGLGAPCETNGPLSAVVSLSPFQLEGYPPYPFSIKITDLDRKYHINRDPNDPDLERALEQALRLVGVDAGDYSAISGAIIDWMDPDDNTHIGGTESAYYQTLDPPYFAKNQPIDDLSELLLVRGVTPDIYWGGVATNHPPAAFQNKLGRVTPVTGVTSYNVGLMDLFTPFSNPAGRININTASLVQLQMIPFVDEVIAAKIIELRSGPDGADGTEDDQPAGMGGPLGSVESMLASAGMNQQVVPLAARFCTVKSSVFEVEVDAEIAGYKRKFFAILAKNNQRDVQVLSFYWKD